MYQVQCMRLFIALNVTWSRPLLLDKCNKCIFWLEMRFSMSLHNLLDQNQNRNVLAWTGPIYIFGESGKGWPHIQCSSKSIYILKFRCVWNGDILNYLDKLSKYPEMVNSEVFMQNKVQILCLFWGRAKMTILGYLKL